MKKFILLFSIFIFIFSPIFAEENAIFKSQEGIVKSIENVDIEPNEINNNYQLQQIVEVEILSGKDKGSFVQVENRLTNNLFYDLFLHKGDKVILHCEENNSEEEFFISDLKRINTIYILTGIFCILLLIIGRKKGVFSLISIISTISFVFLIMLPLISNGVNPIFTALLVGILSTIVSLYLISGINYKSTSAVLGTVISLIIASVLAIITIFTAKLTGFTSEDSMFLMDSMPNLNFTGLLAATIIISTLGATMDIGMSIASAINEIYTIDPNLSKKELFKSGMNVGQDIIGTMANTLILVYLGTSLPLMLLIQNIDLQKFFNLNKVVTEISSALIGSIAIVICVPITALITTYLIKLKKTDSGDIIIEETQETKEM